MGRWDIGGSASSGDYAILRTVEMSSTDIEGLVLSILEQAYLEN